MTKLRDFGRKLRASYYNEELEDVGDWFDETPWRANNKEFHKAFSELATHLKNDSNNYEDFLEEWETNLEMDRDDNPEVTIPEVVENHGSDEFAGFEGDTLRELFEYKYSDSLAVMHAQGWGVEWANTYDNIRVYIFSHPSVDEYDSWMFLKDQETGETCYLLII